MSTPLSRRSRTHRLVIHRGREVKCRPAITVPGVNVGTAVKEKPDCGLVTPKCCKMNCHPAIIVLGIDTVSSDAKKQPDRSLVALRSMIPPVQTIPVRSRA